MAKYYLPLEVNSNQCVTIVSDNHIRVYDRMPSANSTIHYVDFYVNDQYLKSEGSQTFTNYNYSVNCLNNYNEFTNDIWYYPNLWQSLLCFTIITGFGIYLPYKILSRLFGRWLKI